MVAAPWVGYRVRHGEDNAEQEALQADARQRGAEKIARQLSELPGHVSSGRAPKPLRDAVDRLEAVVVELKDHSRRGDRKAAARKAARTRRAKAKSRSGAAARVPGDGPRRSRQHRDRRDKRGNHERRQAHPHPVRYPVSGASAISACFRAESTSHGSPPRLFLATSPLSLRW